MVYPLYLNVPLIINLLYLRPYNYWYTVLSLLGYVSSYNAGFIYTILELYINSFDVSYFFKPSFMKIAELLPALIAPIGDQLNL